MIKITLRITAASVAILLTLVACVIIVFPITNHFFDPTSVWARMSNMILAFLLLETIVFIIVRLVMKRQKRLWDNILGALSKIASGDFNVNLTEKERMIPKDAPIQQLIGNINEVATEMKELEKMRQEFISNVSHEIQSPLTSIHGFAKALKDIDVTEEDRLRYLTIIETESERLSKISDNLLKLTSLESEQQPFEPIAYRLDKQLQRVVLACEPQWLEKNIDMDIEFGEVTVVADKDLMKQVWINIIGNSIKFTHEGGTIGIRVSSEGEEAIVSISDTGIGLTEEEKERIFERFYKADKSRTVSKGGSGLGLSIVKKIVEMHHGNISVESTKGEGTTFRVVLPLQQDTNKQ